MFQHGETQHKYTSGDESVLLPSNFISLAGLLPGEFDRRLGYRRDERYVLFYFEPRGHEVIWQDRESYGFAIGGWRLFTELVHPLAAKFGVHVGDDEAHGSEVLFIDRLLNDAYFAPRQSAEAFLTSIS